MKGYLLLLLTLATLTAFGQTKTVRIGGRAFYFRTFFTENNSGDSTKQVQLSRGKSNLLTHVISEHGYDCNSESIELGAFETTDTTIVFYSYWARAGDAPVSPFGARKQIYTVDKSGQLNLAKSELYIETSGPGWPENKGIEYLFSAPENESERQALKEYIEEVERTYNAGFVFGVNSDLLLKEVRAKLKRQIWAATKGWKMYYADKLGGYKM